ncbi:MAG: 7-carboxy-7-deazaguanine synthase QueE [Thermoplasmata archaeon]
MFYSIQGEGLHMGKPTFFVRTAGCNLRCSWCDTTYSWERGTEMSVEEVLHEVEKQPTRSVCVTGGEPLIWPDVMDLLQALVGRDCDVVLETSGSLSVADVAREDGICVSLDIKCPSSHMEEHMDLGNLALLRPKDQLKFVVANKADYEYAKAVLQENAPHCAVVLQPEGGQSLLPLAEWALRDGLPVRVLPQLHKLIWPEKERGV